MAVDRQPPHNIEAEQSTLGSLIIDPEAYIRVAEFLKADDFYREAHRSIYTAISELNERHEPADLITLCDELERRGILSEVGGPSYVTTLVNLVPTSVHVEHYGHIIERTATMRRLIAAAGQIATLGYEDDDDTDATLDRAEQILFAISQRRLAGDFLPLRTLLHDYLDRIDYVHQHRGQVAGVPTGFVDLDRLTGGLQPSDLIIVGARPSMGKCLSARMLVDDPSTGERLSIEEWVQRRIRLVYGVSEQGTLRPTPVSEWIDSGIKPCFRVTTRTGRSVEVTGHHPFRTVRGWEPLHILGVGDRIAVPTALPAFGEDDSWPLSLVRLLAYFIAEGGLTTTCPKFTNTDPTIVEDFRQIISDHFPTCSIRQDRITYVVFQSRADYRRPNPLVNAIMPLNPVTSWLTRLGLMGKLSKDKSFPKCVWQWSRQHLAEFLRVLLSCDGTIYPLAGRPRIEFCVASEPLAGDVHHALLRFGVIAKKYRTKYGAWRVEITAPDAVKRYQHKIGWIGEKAQRFSEFAAVIPLRLSNVGQAPRDTWRLVQAARVSQGLSMVEIARRAGETVRIGKNAGYNPHMRRGIPRPRLRRYADVLNDDQLHAISSADIYWDEIVSIDAIGEQQVYDLTVPDGENFVAEDIFVHNTALCVSLAHASAMKHGTVVGMFALEMSAEQIVQRFMSIEAAVDQQRLRTGYIEDQEWERIIAAAGALSEAPIYIDDTPGITTMEVRAKARRLAAQVPLGLIIIDYLQLMQGRGRGDGNRVQEISEISRSLKGLARELDVPVVALAQLSRGVESRQDHHPMLSDLRESGSIEQDADIVMFIYRDEVYNPSTDRHGIADIIVAKHRNGPVGQVSLRWLEQTARFVDLELYHQPTND